MIIQQKVSWLYKLTPTVMFFFFLLLSFFFKASQALPLHESIFSPALVNAGKVHLFLLMHVQRFPVLQVTTLRWATTYLMTVCLRFCDSWAMINSPESQLLGRERAFLPRLPRDWGRLAQPGCPSFVIEPYCHPAKRGASPRTKCVCMRFFVWVRLCLCVCVLCVHSPTPAAPLKPWWQAILAFRHILMKL